MARLASDIAVDYANQCMSIVQSARNMRALEAEIATINTSNPLGNLWGTLNTTALNADGTLGTADGSPNAAHPIDPRVYPNMTRAVKASDLANALQFLTDFQAFMAGTALIANGARPANVNAVSE